MDQQGWVSEGAMNEALAREAIRDLVARYNAYGDGGKFELLLELFVPDAVFEIRSPEGGVTRYEGTDALRALFTGTQERVLASAEVKSYVRHFTATHQIDLLEGGKASGRLYFAVLMPHGLDHWGRYLDSYVREGESWRFAERRVEVEGRSENSAFSA